MRLERRIAEVLGADEAAARHLMAAAGDRMGVRALRARAVLLLVLTGPVGGLLPRRLRRRGIVGVVGGMLEEVGDLLVYLELAPPGHAGLLRGP
jgi:uncharacterized protein (DUF4213/DUF364 family)